MSNPNVGMDYQAVSQAAATFDTAARDFQSLVAPLEGVGQLLATQAFLGQTGTAAAEHLGRIQTMVQYVSRRCEEMGLDIRNSIAQYQAGDTEGAQQFSE